MRFPQYFKPSATEADSTEPVSDSDHSSRFNFMEALVYKLRSPRVMVLAAAVLAVLGWTMPLAAQQYLGTLSGNVTDSTGAKIVGAQVTATDVTTNFVTKVVTNGSGDYSIPFLTPDTYTVTIVANGFRSESRTGVTLTAGQNQATDFSLKPGTPPRT